MNARPGPFNDIRDAPAYSFPEASRHLGVPQATLRYWVLGRMHQGEPGLPVSEPLIRAPSGSGNRITFNNLVEAHVLRALRTRRGVRMSAVRDALTYAENSLGIRRLLLRDELSTSGQDRFSRIFFVDRDLGRHIFPEALESAGLIVERRHDHFAHDTPDESWLPEVTAREWIAVTGDQKILRRAP